MGESIRVKYKTYRQTKKNEEYGEYSCYGVEAATCVALLRHVDDVTCERDAAENLVVRMNYYGLSVLHLDDAIDDFLCF